MENNDEDKQSNWEVFKRHSRKYFPSKSLIGSKPAEQNEHTKIINQNRIEMGITHLENIIPASHVWRTEDDQKLKKIVIEEYRKSKLRDVGMSARNSTTHEDISE